MSMSDIQKAIKEALEKATDNGMWNADKEPWPGNENLQYWISSQMDGIACSVTIEDAHLIANAPTWLLHQQELIEQLQRKLDEGVELVEEGMVLVELFGKKLEKQEAEIERLTEQLEYSKLTPMQKMSRAMEIIDKQKGADT